MVDQELAAVVARAKVEIIHDTVTGAVPATICDFSGLHEHVDANGYGGAFEDDAHTVSDVEFWNSVQCEVDTWICGGGLKPVQALRTLAVAIEEGTLEPRHLSREGVYLSIIRYLQEHVTDEVRNRANGFLGMVA